MALQVFLHVISPPREWRSKRGAGILPPREQRPRRNLEVDADPGLRPIMTAEFNGLYDGRPRPNAAQSCPSTKAQARHRERENVGHAIEHSFATGAPVRHRATQAVESEPLILRRRVAEACDRTRWSSTEWSRLGGGVIAPTPKWTANAPGQTTAIPKATCGRCRRWATHSRVFLAPTLQARAVAARERCRRRS